MDKLITNLEKILKFIVSILLCLLVLNVSYVAMKSYIFNDAPAWGESLALLFMVWFCMLSSAIGVISKIHLRMTIMDNIFSQKTINYLEHFTNVLWIVFGILAIVKGIELTALSNKNIITGLNINSSIVYAAVPVFGLIVSLASINEEIKLCKVK